MEDEVAELRAASCARAMARWRSPSTATRRSSTSCRAGSTTMSEVSRPLATTVLRYLASTLVAGMLVSCTRALRSGPWALMLPFCSPPETTCCRKAEASSASSTLASLGMWLLPASAWPLLFVLGASVEGTLVEWSSALCLLLRADISMSFSARRLCALCRQRSSSASSSRMRELWALALPFSTAGRGAALAPASSVLPICFSSVCTLCIHCSSLRCMAALMLRSRAVISSVSLRQVSSTSASRAADSASSAVALSALCCAAASSSETSEAGLLCPPAPAARTAAASRAATFSATPAGHRLRAAGLLAPRASMSSSPAAISRTATSATAFACRATSTSRSACSCRCSSLDSIKQACAEGDSTPAKLS
mmetsp:Transcript_33187/g.93982  ORF Transcript_33187/g.93982 Transcript_33187/m.93982 type:complete len:367 (+) Transcript_33187:94-1194(+)